MTIIELGVKSMRIRINKGRLTILAAFCVVCWLVYGMIGRGKVSSRGCVNGVKWEAFNAVELEQDADKRLLLRRMVEEMEVQHD